MLEHSMNRKRRQTSRRRPLHHVLLPFRLAYLLGLVALLLWCPLSSGASSPRCSSASPHRFNPRASPSPSSSLTFCTSYASSTCCNSSHTNVIVKAVYPFFSFSADDRAEGYGVSEECKNLASSIYCAPCNPLVGTQVERGVCRASCDEWYEACASSLFERVGGLQPCSPSSLICTPLHAIVHSGEEFCKAMGVPIGSDAPSSPSLTTPSSSSSLHAAFSTFLTDALSFHASKPRPGTNDDALPCFSASSAPPTIVPTSKKTSTSSSSTSASPSPSPTPSPSSSSSASVPFPLFSPFEWRDWLSRAFRRSWKAWTRGGMKWSWWSAVGMVAVAVAVVGGAWASGYLDYWPGLRRRMKAWLRGRPSPERLRQQRIAKLTHKS